MTETIVPSWQDVAERWQNTAAERQDEVIQLRLWLERAVHQSAQRRDTISELREKLNVALKENRELRGNLQSCIVEGEVLRGELAEAQKCNKTLLKAVADTSDSLRRCQEHNTRALDDIAECEKERFRLQALVANGHLDNEGPKPPSPLWLHYASLVVRADEAPK